MRDGEGSEGDNRPKWRRLGHKYLFIIIISSFFFIITKVLLYTQIITGIIYKMHDGEGSEGDNGP